MDTKVLSWAMYDFANTAFSALFVTFFFPMYIKEVLGGNEFQIGLVFGGSMFFVALLVPLIGTYSDITGKRVAIVRFFTIVCVFCTALIALFDNLYAALFFGFISNFFYHACLVVYNSTIMLVVKNKKNLGKISGYGVAVGYLGTFFSIITAYFVLYMTQIGQEQGVRIMFPITGAFFLLFSIPFFWKVKDKIFKVRKTFLHKCHSSVCELIKTLKKINSYKGLVPFLLSSLCFSNGFTAAVVFLFLYAREPPLNIVVQEFMFILVVFALASALGSYISGKLTDTIGAKYTLLISGTTWMLVVGILLLPQVFSHWSRETVYAIFILSGLIGGAAMGAIWTANRPMLIGLAPKVRVGQFFGFTELTDKFSGVFGPIIFGYLVVSSGYPLALSSLILFFLIGIGFLVKVPNIRF